MLLRSLSLLASVVSRTLAYDWILEQECKDELQQRNMNRYFTQIVRDARILADAAFYSWPRSTPDSSKPPLENKAKEPLAANLFGSLTPQQYALATGMIDKAQWLANEDLHTNTDARFRVRCKKHNSQHGVTVCDKGTLMQNFKGEGNPGAIDVIVICQSFWNKLDRELYKETLSPAVLDKACKMKPLTLGLSFGGRLLYHETIHSSYLQDESIDNGDWGYGVDQGSKKVTRRLTELEKTSDSIGNPDTYSYYAILAWRRHLCRWRISDIPRGKTLNFPTTNIPKSQGNPDKSLYGDTVRCPSGTKATIDTVEGQPEGKYIDVLWCKLTDQENGACPGEWSREGITTLSGPRMEVLRGCFQSRNPTFTTNTTDWTEFGGGLQQQEVLAA
ncbi:MAG: hypothetical protein Q9190_006007 [Brigantiaea leucoxantha]